MVNSRTIELTAEDEFVGITNTRSYSFQSFAGSSGTNYIGGFYDVSTTDANLTQASTTVTHGDANVSYAAHAILVASGAGAASGGSGAVTIVVSGTSITDAGVRTAADSETIVSDITAMSTDEYFETDKKWLGTITYTLTVGATGHTAYSADFNYGYAKYEDFGNRNFTVTDFEVVGVAGVNDTGFDVQLQHHKATGWTYAASGFDPGTGALVDMNTDHSTEQNLSNGEPFAYKRTSLSTAVNGGDGEGTVIRVVTGANGSVQYLDAHIRVTLEAD